MVKNNKKKQAKPKGKGDKRGKKAVKVSPSNPCANCNDNEAVDGEPCGHGFCLQCKENLTAESVFKCPVCNEDASISDVALNTVLQCQTLANHVEKLPPVPPVDMTPVDFAELGKGVKKLTSFTHLAFDTVERVVVDKDENFICVNPVDHKIYFFKNGRLTKGVKYLFNHGFTGGLSLSSDNNALLVLQGAKFTSICIYTIDGKFKKATFFHKGAYSHSIAVGVDDTIFALDGNKNMLHFFNRERKMCLGWSLKSAAAQGIDLWDCSLIVNKDNKVMLFDANSCQLYEIVSDDEIVLRVSFSEENTTDGNYTTEQSAESESDSAESHKEYDSMWTKKKLTYDSDNERDGEEKTADAAEVNTAAAKDDTPAKPTAVTVGNKTEVADMKLLHDIPEVSENSQPASETSSKDGDIVEQQQEDSQKSKRLKSAKKKRKSAKNLNKNNNSNGDSDTNSSAQHTRSPRKPFDPKMHPSLLALDKYDCILVAHRGKIALFSPDGQYIKSIVELAECEDQLFKITIKCMVPFGENKLAVLWHKHGGLNMYRFVEIYSYKTPKKYKQVRGVFGRRKFAYDLDTTVDSFTETVQSTCCVLQ